MEATMPDPTPVQNVAIHGVSISAILLGVLNVLAGGSIVAWIRSRGGWKKAEIESEEKIRGEMWNDIAALKLAKEGQSRRLTIAEAQIAGQTIQIGQQRFILTLVIDELERVSPGNSVARQARILFRDIQPQAMPAPEEVAEMTETIARVGVD
jgi:hypothetical protein